VLSLQGAGPWQKAELANLRRGIGKSPAELPEVWEITLADIPDELTLHGTGDGRVATDAEWAIHSALTLYALHQQSNSQSVYQAGRSFATAVRSLITPINEEAVKRRFDAVVTAGDLAELSYYARGLIQLLKASKTSQALDYPRLARDLYEYCYPEGRNRVRMQWGQDFYKAVEKSDIEHGKKVVE